VPRCVPANIKRNRHGDRAVSVVVGTERELVSGKWRTIEVRACPVTWRPHPEQITSARGGYEDWWRALDWVRDGLVVGGMLRDMEVTTAMPEMCLGCGKLVTIGIKLSFAIEHSTSAKFVN
jgi:hypothetical protein